MFNVLNMCSANDRSDPPEGDRTAKARIRDAAVACFAEYGTAGATARKVAARAGVSPGLVMHHFESMDGLRAACDEHVAAVIRDLKSEALAAGPGIDVLAALRQSDTGDLTRYLARVLVDDSPAVARLVDDLVDDAEGYFGVGVEAGTIRPSRNPRGRAVLLTVWQLGAIVLHEHVERLLGVDLTDPQVGADPSIVNYAGPVYEVLGEGFFTEEFNRRLQEVIGAMTRAQSDDDLPADSPSDGPRMEGNP
jgi:AcrR family transcriptional regulator